MANNTRQCPRIWVVIAFRSLIGLAACVPYGCVLRAGIYNGWDYIPYALFGTVSGWVLILVGLPSIIIALGLAAHQGWAPIVAIIHDIILLLIKIHLAAILPFDLDNLLMGVVVPWLPFFAETVYLLYILYRRKHIEGDHV